MMARMSHRWLHFLLICVLGSHPSRSVWAEPVDFEEDIAPILQARCLTCHNAAERKGDLSLVTSEAAFADGYVVPHDAASSELWLATQLVDGKARMPKDAEPLAKAESDLIRRWIDEGASWPDDVSLSETRVTDFQWWSLQPLSQPTIPKTQEAWGRTPIDAFILAQLQQRGLSPSPEADRRTLIRRLTFDLIGLPPSPAEVEAFVADPDPLAYEKLVDRLLDSPHYGERWARHWLDVVKYADTCGYDKDKLRPNAWPYRDYVIRSFNEDKPYHRFVQEQIAGDVLFPGDPDGILALGFIAAGPWDFIGHVEVPETKIDGQVARNLDRDDMVSNAINTFCSVTIQCARCHHHKFDPITQEHYYGLQAVFAAVDRADRRFDPDPATARRRATLQTQQQNIQAQLAALESEIAREGGQALANLNHEIDQLQRESNVREPATRGYHSAIEDQPDASKWVEVALTPPTPISRVVLHPCFDNYAGIGAGFGFPVRFHVELIDEGGEHHRIYDHTEGALPNPGLTPLTISCQDFEAAKQVSAIRVTAVELVERKDDFIFALAELEAFDSDGRQVARNAPVRSLDSIEAAPSWARTNLTDGLWPEAGNELTRQQLAKASQARTDLLARLETTERVERRQALRDQLTATQAALAELPPPQKVYAAATQFEPQGNFHPTGGTPRAVHVLSRGNVQQPLEPATPGVFPLNHDDRWQFEASWDESQRRAALANWLSDEDHPLVWRSIVNRVWHYHFGRGIVTTPNDFGRMGALPTHPKLLDWLAGHFRDSGQSLKDLHRLIVTSAVYRQSSSHRPDQAAIDADNQFLWRMNRRRLEAEEIRDAMLHVSGALNTAMGGPGFYLFELEKTEHSPHYEYHKFDPSDTRSHRRSIYRFIVRSQPHPWMTTLDCADSSQSTPKRIETVTSLQALSLLNNRFVLVMAEQFADRLRGTQPDLDSQIDAAIQLILQRDATRDEQAAMTRYAQQHGLENLCRFLFNLSEFVYVD